MNATTSTTAISTSSTEEILSSWEEEYKHINATIVAYDPGRQLYTLQSYGYAMVSDAYKEVNGIRPRWHSGASPQFLAEEYARLCAEIKSALEQERADEKAHQKAVETAFTPTYINSFPFMP